MMAKFKVYATDTVYKDFIVTAKNEEEAIGIAQERFSKYQSTSGWERAFNAGEWDVEELTK